MRIRKGDVVEIITGADLGKKGRVLSVQPSGDSAIVEGMNFVYKHNRPTRDDPQGGRIQKEASIHMSNLLPVCNKCGRGVRVKRQTGENGSMRVCAGCGEVV